MAPAARKDDAPIYFTMACYNLELLVTYALFIIWNIVPDEERHAHASGIARMSFLLPVLAQTVSMMLGMALFIVVQYYGRWTWRELHFALRFYAVNIMASSFVIYAWLIIGLMLHFQQRHSACVTITIISFQWFCLGIYLYDVCKAKWKDNRLQMEIRPMFDATQLGDDDL